MTAVTTRTYTTDPTGSALLRAAVQAVPGAGLLRGRGERLPDLEMRRHRVRTDVEHLQTYRELCGFGRRHEIPATYPHLSAFGLHVSLMNDRSFPFSPMGLVHLRNAITVHRPLAIDEAFDVAVRPANLRAHAKGRLVDLLTTITVGTETVWTGTTTLLSRGDSHDVTPSGADAALADVAAPRGVVRWRLPGDLGRRYGAVSGDRNPIHLHPLTARPFGFRRNIAHGMWTAARCLAALENRIPADGTLTVEFRRPVLLPGTVVFGVDPPATLADETTFGVTSLDGDHTHLVGRFSPA